MSHRVEKESPTPAGTTRAAKAGPSKSLPPPPPAVFWQATRAYSFPASVAPILLGAALARRGYGVPDGYGSFDVVAFLLTLVGGVLAHAGANVLNDYFDFVRGVDTRPEHGSGVLTKGLMTKNRAALFAIQLLMGAALCAILLLMRSPGLFGLVVPLGLLGLFCAACYTPFLKQRALGDLVIMAAFGLGLTLGAYGVQTPIVGLGQFGLVLLFAFPLNLLVDAILHANNMRDAANDQKSGVTTVAALLGPNGSWILQAVLLFGPVVLTAAFSAFRLLPWSVLATLLAAPVLVKAYRTGDVPFCAQAHLLFGLLYAIGILALPHP